MAGVLDHLVPYVQQMVKDMAAEELRVLVGVAGGIKKLGATTEYFQDYATDAERRRIDDASMKRWVRKLKDALYEATNILELYQLHAEDKERRRQRQLGAADCWTIIEEKAPGFLEPLLFCLRNPGFAHVLGVRLKQLNASFDEIRREMVELGANPLHRYPVEWRSQPGEASTHRSRKTMPSLSRSSTLVQELLADDDEPAHVKIKVVSIVDAGGLGKTTLVQNIFNCGDIQVAVKIWFSITESYDDKLLSSADAQGLSLSLRRSSTVVVGDAIECDTSMLVHELLADDVPAAAAKTKVVSIVGAGGMGKTTLAKNIFNHDDIQAGFAVKIRLSVTNGYDEEKLLSSADEQGLSPSRTGKLLLVMDDVWSKRPWDTFNPLINNGAAARVVITTRDEGLLRDIATLQRHVKPLCDEDARSLLKQLVMVSQDVVDNLHGCTLEE